MTQKEKDLLLKDLCSRLPYGVKIHIGKTQRIEIFDDINLRIGSINNTYADIKPYLFPFTSMTEEQKKEYRDAIRPATIASIEENDKDKNNFPSLITIAPDVVSVDWCNRNHFDYRGLIPMGLALDATGLNIY